MSQAVCVIAGSKSDDDITLAVVKVLNEMNVPHSRHVCSAHRDPERLERIIRDAEEDGCKVYICIAGMAAHLPGVVASKTIRPVIGVPAGGSKLNGMDALLSIVQMPKGIPVACVAVDGGTNAGLLACQVLAIHTDWDELRNLLYTRREKATEV